MLPNTKKTPGIWFALVLNSLILKIQDIAIFATKVSLMKFSQISEIGTGNISSLTGTTQGICKKDLSGTPL